MLLFWQNNVKFFGNICLKFVGLLPDRSLLADYVTCQKSAQASSGRLGMGRKIWLWILRFKFWSNPYEKTPTLGQLSPKCQMSAGISKKHLLRCSPHIFTKKRKHICDFWGNPYRKTTTFSKVSNERGNFKNHLSCSPHIFTKIRANANFRIHIHEFQNIETNSALVIRESMW